MKILRTAAGFTLIELIATVFIISILLGVAVPLARNSIQRQKEVALREALRELRTAIDKYKDASDRGFIPVKVVPIRMIPRTTLGVAKMFSMCIRSRRGLR